MISFQHNNITLYNIVNVHEDGALNHVLTQRLPSPFGGFDVTQVFQQMSYQLEIHNQIS